MPVRIIRNENEPRNIYYEFDSDAKYLLGEGGMGRVYKGKQVEEIGGFKREREIALKLLFDDLPQSAIDRSKREASIRIKSDNLVEMIDFVETYEEKYGNSIKHYHVVSEFLDGLALDDLLIGKTTNHDGQPNPTAQRLFKDYNENRKVFVGTVFRSILSGVQALHDKGFIHRDIDPSNIMVTSDGRIKLIDFGIARQVKEIGTQDKHLTKSGQFVGKAYYAAPELISGDIAHQDFTTDVYALGIMFFQLVVGHLPFDGPSHEVAMKQMHDKLPLSEVKDKTLRRIIEKATDKKQNKRYQSAAELRVDIDKWINSTPQPHSSKWLTVAGITSIAMVAVVAWLFYKFGKDKQTENNSDLGYAAAIQLLSDGNTAEDGLSMLNELKSKKNYDATFLLSRLYFDPMAAKEKGTEFYDEKWDTMRNNCGLEASNEIAHELLMDALEMDGAERDCRLYYELGCDYLYARGVESKDFNEAKEYFSKIDEWTKNDSESEYGKAISEKLVAVGLKEPTKPNFETAVQLLSDSNTAKEGLLMIEELREKDYKAIFLLSRLYFDPIIANEKGTEFYEKKWQTMRDDCGLVASNEEAHELLMKAFQMEEAESDYKLLYELGCDFLYARGIHGKKDYHKARWCFLKVDDLAKEDTAFMVAISEKLKAVKGYSLQKP